MSLNDYFDDDLYDSIFSVGRNFLSSGNYEKALIIFDGLVALFPKEISCVAAYGEVLLITGQAQKSLDFFLQVDDSLQDKAPIVLGLARALVLLKEYDQAKSLSGRILDGTFEASSLEIALAKSIYLTSQHDQRRHMQINEN